MKRFFLLLLAAIIGLLPLMSACAEAPLDGYPGIDELPAIDTINNPFEFFDVKNDPNGDGIVTAEEDAEVDELSRKVRRRIIVGTTIFAIPCIVMTAGSIGSAQAGVQDGYGVTETTRELAAVLPGFKDYTVAVETLATEGDEEGIVEREIVAHVTTSEALGAHDRRVARKLIDLNVPELDRVEFDVK